MNNILQRLQQFRSSMGNVNPDHIIQQLLQSGKLTQDQYNQAREAAENLKKMINPGAQGQSHK